QPCRVLGARMARPVAHGTALPARGHQVLALQVREHRGDRGVGVMAAQAGDQLTDRPLVVGPQLLHHLLLQRPQPHLVEGAGALGAAHRAAARRERAAAGSGQATWPRRRETTAISASARARAARKGCAGANQVSAPPYPRASSASLLHTGQPTANQASIPAAVPVRASRRSPTSTELASREPRPSAGAT